jgi:hypothetical protein
MLMKTSDLRPLHSRLSFVDPWTFGRHLTDGMRDLAVTFPS